MAIPKAAATHLQNIFVPSWFAKTETLFQHYFRRYGWDWPAELIRSHSRLTRGYPLFMAERLAEILKPIRVDNEK